MKRLFTFGCSFTSYVWPTWADIVGQSFEYYENWGMCGIGNKLISNKLVECHHMNNITKDDVVFVMFTSIPRIDFYNGHWSMAGNIFNTFNKKYEKLWVERNWSITQGYYDTWMAVKNTKVLLDNIGCEYKLFKAFNIRPDLPSEHAIGIGTDYMFNTGNDSRFLEIYKNDIDTNFEINESMSDFVTDEAEYYIFNSHKTMNAKKYRDSHPTIKHHEEWCKKYLSEYYTNAVDVSHLENCINYNEFTENDLNNYTSIKLNPRFGILPS